MLLSAIAAALCCLTRYMGFAVEACAVVALLILGQGPFRAKALRIVAYMVSAVAPAGVWLIRGWIDAPPGGYSWPRGFDALDAFDIGVSQALLYFASIVRTTGSSMTILRPGASTRLFGLYAACPRITAS